MNIDDFSPTIDYSTGWAPMSNSTGTPSASAWFNGTFHQCASSAISTGPNCEAVISFTGTGVKLYGDSTAAKGRFWCTVKENESDRHWFNAGSIPEWGLNRLLCSVSGLTNGAHQVVLGQTASDCGDAGVALDFYTPSTDASSYGDIVWASDLSRTDPSPLFPVNTTTSAASSSSSTTTTRSSATSSTSSLVPGSVDSTSSSASVQPIETAAAATSGGGGTNTTAIGAGVGAGGAVLGLILLGAVWYQRRRRNHGPHSGASSAGWSASNGDRLEDMTAKSYKDGSPVSYAPRGSAAPPWSPESRSAPFSTYTVPEVHMDTAGSTTDLATSTGSPTSRRVRERATSNSTTLAGLEDPRVFAPR